MVALLIMFRIFLYLSKWKEVYQMVLIILQRKCYGLFVFFNASLAIGAVGKMDNSSCLQNRVDSHTFKDEWIGSFQVALI
jgi:hypothetical protein